MKKIFVIFIIFLCLGCTKKTGTESKDTEEDLDIPEWDDAAHTGHPLNTKLTVKRYYSYSYYDEEETGVFLHTVPHINGEKIKRLSYNTEVTVLERGEYFSSVGGLYNHYWYKVNADGETGWVFGGYLSLQGFEYSIKEKSVEITGYTGDAALLEIPASIEGLPVTAIGENAFRERKFLIGVILPNSLITIGERAFYNCENITAAKIPEGVTSIGEEAFYRCQNLTSVTLGNKVAFIGRNAFYGVNFMSITLPDSLVTIIGTPFYGCANLIEINVSAGNPLYSSQDGVLYDKEKRVLIRCPEGKTGTVNIPESVTHIRDLAFHEGVGTYTRPQVGTEWTKTEIRTESKAEDRDEDK